MGATFSRVKTWVNGETLSHTDLNAEFDNILNNLDPAGVDDYSATVANMQTTADPYPGAVPSQATSLQGELQRIRYLIWQITGETYWYIDPDATIAGLVAGTTAVNKADTLLVGASYRSASQDPDANEIVCLDGNGRVLLGTTTVLGPIAANTMRYGQGDRDYSHYYSPRFMYFGANSNFDGTNYSYITTNAAAQIGVSRDYNGIQFQKAASGTAGTTISWTTYDIPMSVSGQIRTKIIDIGDWNIDSAATSGTALTVAHGLTHTKIRAISVTIRSDDDANYYNGVNGFNYVYAGSANVVIQATSGGIFDNASFASLSFNRGWITITYIE